MTNTGDEMTSPLTPSEAFSVLGNETRLEILQTLGEADEPLPFTALRKRLGNPVSSQYNYHLDRLVGHFIRQSDGCYELTSMGERVIEAILAGSVTESPTVEPTELDERCYHCGTPIWIDYKDQTAFIYCNGCSGNYQISDDVLVDRLGSEERAAEFAVKTSNCFPPTLVNGRSASEMRQAGTAWFHLDMFSWGIDLCPRCSAVLDPSVELCETHDATEGVCEKCGNLQATILVTSCTNCHYSKEGLFSYRLFSHTAMLDFITDHGFNPIAPDSPEAFWGYFTPYDEEILSTDPFKARFTFTIERDALTLTVDDDLNVVDTTRHDTSETA